MSLWQARRGVVRTRRSRLLAAAAAAALELAVDCSAGASSGPSNTAPAAASARPRFPPPKVNELPAAQRQALKAVLGEAVALYKVTADAGAVGFC
jgi:hypothetical protein